jgi:hypothetical protein
MLINHDPHEFTRRAHVKHLRRVRARQAAESTWLEQRGPWLDWTILALAAFSVAIVIYTAREFYEMRQEMAAAQLALAQSEGLCLQALAGQAYDAWLVETRQMRGTLQ